MFNPNKLPEFPPEAETVLPPDVWAKLKEIKASSASIQEKRAQIHAVMQTVPDEVLDKLPEPKEFAGLPAEVGVKLRIDSLMIQVKAQLKALHRQRDLPIEKKKEKFEALLKTLPAEQQKLLVG